MMPRTAHPRSRGENSNDHSTNIRDDGSSPLTRGKPLAYTEADDARGLIPAHAGKTVRACKFDLVFRAHPRSRGENDPQQPHREPHEGSSPLTRGKQAAIGRRCAQRGLIPAHAGKTGLHYTSRTVYRAHPRSRGENLRYQSSTIL